MGSTNKKKRCYVTTAACESRGLPDDCHELMTMRWFRDNVVSRTATGRAEIARYYATAPSIVNTIDSQPDSAVIYDRIFSEYVAPTVAAIEDGKHIEARTRILRAVDELQRRFGADQA